MSIRPSDFYETAQRLALSGIEADIRSAISRAYYAAMHSANAVLPDDFRSSNREHDTSSHQAVIDDMVRYGCSNMPGRTEAKQIANLLPKLKKRRKTADYYLDKDLENGELSVSLNMASKILELSSIIAGKNTSQSA